MSKDYDAVLLPFQQSTDKLLSSKVAHKLHARIIRRLDALNVAHKLEDLQLPDFDLHMLSGHNSKRYTIHVNGPWCMTFEFMNGNAEHVHFENYH